MQFYDLFKDLIGYVPADYGEVRSFLGFMLPVVLVVCALFTSFFGLKCAALWCSVTLFFVGSSFSAKYLLPNRDLTDANFWIMFAVCLIIGMLLGVFSKYPARIQLIVGLFTLVYASLPSFISFFGETFSKVISFIVALALAFLTVKYKYIIIIATTSFSGSFIFWNVMDDEFSIKYKTFYAVVMGIAALAFQCYMNYDKLKETYKDVKMKYEKTERGGKKAVKVAKEKMHINPVMKNIKIIFWDFDNTLLDFTLAAHNSLINAFEKYNLGECTEEMIEAYHKINDKYWQMLERGEQTKEEILVNRFKEFFDLYGIKCDFPEEFKDAYENGIPDTISYIDNSFEIVSSLKGKYKQYIVTNGGYEVQKKRLRASGFSKLVEGAFISDKLKYEKPNKEFFDIVFDSIPACDKNDVLIVGDSLTSDMKGGNNAGIKTCWYNPKGKKRPKDIHIDCEIKQLNELYKIIGYTE